MVINGFLDFTNIYNSMTAKKIYACRTDDVPNVRWDQASR